MNAISGCEAEQIIHFINAYYDSHYLTLVLSIPLAVVVGLRLDDFLVWSINWISRQLGFIEKE